MTQTRTDGTATQIPLLDRIREAFAVSGAIVRPPAMPQGIDLKGYTSPGTVPANLRGMVDLHDSLRREAERMADKFETRRRNCRAGDCACRAHSSGFAAEIKLMESAKAAIENLRQVELLLAPALARSLGGFDISEGDYVIASDWRVMVPPNATATDFAATIAEMIGDAMTRARDSGDANLNLLVLRVDGTPVAFDPSSIASMSAVELRQHVVSKLSPATAAKLEKNGHLEQIVVELGLAARSASAEARFSDPRMVFGGFGGVPLSEVLAGLGIRLRTPRRAARADA